MRLTLRWPAMPGEVYSAEAARSLFHRSIMLHLEGSQPVLAVVVSAEAINDESGSALDLTLEFDPPNGQRNGLSVLGTQVL